MSAARCAGCGGELRVAEPCPLCRALSDPPGLAPVCQEEPSPAPGRDGDDFDRDAEAYDRYLASGRGWLRQELAVGLLLRCVPGLAQGALRILDAGAGSGRLAVRLAALGNEVRLLDPSARMLELAAAHAAEAGATIQQRLALTEGTVEAVVPRLGERFDLVLAHNLLEFVPDPARAVELLAGALGPAGRLSLFVANRMARAVASAHDGCAPEVIAASLAQRRFATELFGGARVEFSPAELERLVAQAGLTRVRSFAAVTFSGVSPLALPESPGARAEWLRLELAAAAEPAYLGLARYVLCLAEVPA